LAVDTTPDVSRRIVHPRRETQAGQGDTAHLRAAALDHAVAHLARSAPHFSASTPFWWRQIFIFTILTAAFVVLSVVAPATALEVLLLSLAVPFACIVVFRIAAITRLLVRRDRSDLRMAHLSGAELPTYSVLMPLVGEANMAPQIVAAMRLLDYPAEKLEVLIVLEDHDAATQAAFAALPLPPHFRVIVVPTASPRTKPKALNYALCFAGGDYVVVYDAEDLPNPSQLKRAACTFALAPPNVACLQAPLLIHNANESWLTRHFSLEYMALFDGLLPAYRMLGAPLPLGGTSNHFPRELLQDLGAWDPYNVTEDADLGMRLARCGLEARMLASETWEEAPDRYSDWLPQRTRWLKGWMQTWLVHTRHPFRLLRDMGPAGFIGFHMIFGGMLLAALVHPAMYGLLIWQYFTIGPFATPVDGLGLAFTMLSASNLAFGYVTAMLLSALCAIWRGQTGLIFHIITLPVYWLLISAAAWRALFQLLVAPFHWEKTRHRMRR